MFYPVSKYTSVTASLAVMALGVSLGVSSPAIAKQCEASAFSNEVDAAGAALRQFNSEMAPVLQTRIAQLKTAKGWTDDNFQSLAQDYLFDARTAALDGKANTLLLRLDELGAIGEEHGADCAKLDELKATGVELLAVMKAKSSYTLAKIDEEIAAGRGVNAKPSTAAKTAVRLPEAEPAEPFADAPSKPAPKKPTSAKNSAKPAEKKPASKPKPQPQPQKTAKVSPAPKPPAVNAWQTTTQQAPETNGPQLGPGPQPLADGTRVADSQFVAPPPGAFAGPEEGYSIEEIRDATRGFFGSISTNLATVIEHTFSKWGQPTGYVLGKEGGGAFLAGVRYGSGTLFMRNGQRMKVYWHGPSLGYDFGAEGSRTMFLAYSLDSPEGLFRNYTGVNGSAYLVGGVGVTLLKGGRTILAPIRTGLGLRIGANIGYIRFTKKQTWNPF
ncbi:MAG: EipA family protein [Filomicrobium sp.]